MQQQNYLLLPDAVKQEPISPNYASTSPTPPPHQRYTPSPNPLHPASVSPNIPIQGIPQSHFDMVGGYIPSVSPLQNPNILNQQQQQYQPQPNQNQFNIPNTNIVNAAVNFLNNNPNMNNQTEQRTIGDILTNNNLNNINQLDNIQNTNNENVLDNVSGMNISSLLDLDSQQQINTNELGLSNDLLNDLLKNIDNGEPGTNQAMTINTIQTNTFGADEENMTDSFKQISIE